MHSTKLYILSPRFTHQAFKVGYMVVVINNHIFFKLTYFM